MQNIHLGFLVDLLGAIFFTMLTVHLIHMRKNPTKTLKKLKKGSRAYEMNYKMLYKPNYLLVYKITTIYFWYKLIFGLFIRYYVPYKPATIFNSLLTLILFSVSAYLLFANTDKDKKKSKNDWWE